MPVPGAKRKPPGHAVTRHVGQDFIEVPNVRFRGKALPARRNGKPWPDGITEKWAAWSTMPHCVFWAREDWEFAIDAIHLAAKFIDKDSDAHVGAELRNREKVMGTTMDYRRDIRIRYVDPKPTTTGDVANLDDYRDL